MSANVEPEVLLAGPALAADRSLRRRLSGDYILQTADTIERATAAMDRGDIDIVVCEQQFEDGRGVIFIVMLDATLNASRRRGRNAAALQSSSHLAQRESFAASVQWCGATAERSNQHVGHRAVVAVTRSPPARLFTRCRVPFARSSGKARFRVVLGT